MFVKYSRNLAAEAQDHKGPDQRKIYHVGDDRVKASDKKHGWVLGLIKQIYE